MSEGRQIKKVLFVATVIRFLGFEKNDIKLLQDMGCQVHCAANMENEGEGTKEIDMVRHQIDFERTPFHKKNLLAYRQLKKLLSTEQFDMIHCHTPVGGVTARLAGRKYRKKGMRIIYTAHGFHFYQGAPWKNWCFYYPIEWLCSWMTDVLITINKEDYKRAKKQFHARSVEYVPGVGVDLKKFKMEKEGRLEKREELGIAPDDFLLISVGELSTRKNHEIVLEAIAKMKKSNVKYIICGTGEKKAHLEKVIQKFGLKEQVQLLGRRNDIKELLNASDLFVFPSKQEGLPVALMEAMGCGLPCVVSDIRGNRDLIEETGEDLFASEQEGRKVLFVPVAVADLQEKITRMMENIGLRETCSRKNSQKIKDFCVEKIQEKMWKIYKMDGEV